jgi:hypothetical protein
MNVLVPWSKTALDISSFLLAAECGYYTKGGWDFKGIVCWMQHSFESIQ